MTDILYALREDFDETWIQEYPRDVIWQYVKERRLAAIEIETLRSIIADMKKAIKDSP